MGVPPSQVARDKKLDNDSVQDVRDGSVGLEEMKIDERG